MFAFFPEELDASELLEKLQVGNNGHKNKEIREISQNYDESRKKPKTTLTPYQMVDSR